MRQGQALLGLSVEEPQSLILAGYAKWQLGDSEICS